jgi:hypothetical protein
MIGLFRKLFRRKYELLGVTLHSLDPDFSRRYILRSNVEVRRISDGKTTKVHLGYRKKLLGDYGYDVSYDAGFLSTVEGDLRKFALSSYEKAWKARCEEDRIKRREQEENIAQGAWK